MTNEDLAYRTAIGAEIDTWVLQYLISGQKYITGNLFTGVSDTNTKKVVIENNETDHALLVIEPTINSDGQVISQRTQNVSVDTDGTNLTVTNLKTDVSNSINLDVTTAGDNDSGVVSGGTSLPQITLGSGSNSGNGEAGISGALAISDVVAPEDTLSITATNESGSASDVNITVAFIRVPTDALAEIDVQT